MPMIVSAAGVNAHQPVTSEACRHLRGEQVVRMKFARPLGMSTFIVFKYL